MRITDEKLKGIVLEELTTFLIENGHATQQEIDEGLFDWHKSPILRWLGLSGARGRDYGTMKKRLKALQKARRTGADVNISQAGKPLINQVRSAVKTFMDDMDEVGVPLDRSQRTAIRKLVDDLQGGLDSILSQTH